MKDSKSTTSDEPEEPLGHGSHWESLGFTDIEQVMTLVTGVLNNPSGVKSFAPPWPGAGFAKLLQFSLQNANIEFTVIAGLDEAAKQIRFLSGFPTFLDTEKWILRVDKTLDSYGPVEGVISGEAASGHGLQWFAPNFGSEAESWRRGRLMRVGVAALAVSIELYDATPLIIREGHLVEKYREELRSQGKLAEADNPDLSVTVETEGMRTFYSSYHDHHHFIGKILGVRRFRVTPNVESYVLDLECLPDSLPTGCRLPLYVFDYVMKNGYKPAQGDLVQGTAWLQGTWLGEATAEEEELWRQSSPP